MTLHEYVNLIRGFAVAHKSLKGSFFEGYDENFDTTKVQNYPVLIMNILPTTFTEFEIGYVAEFSVLDKVDTDRINRLSVQSDTEMICKDLAAFIFNSDELDLTIPGSIEHVDGVFDDDVSGSSFTGTATVFQPLNVCSVPSSTLPVPPSNNVKIYDQDGNVIATLYPGQKYTVEVLRQIIQTLNDPAPATIIQTLT